MILTKMILTSLLSIYTICIGVYHIFYLFYFFTYSRSKNDHIVHIDVRTLSTTTLNHIVDIDLTTMLDYTNYSNYISIWRLSLLSTGYFSTNNKNVDIIDISTEVLA